jgi:hypothetical protein
MCSLRTQLSTKASLEASDAAAYGALWLVVTMTSRPWALHMAKTFSISRTSCKGDMGEI